MTQLKKSNKAQMVKYFTKAHLQEAARKAPKWDFNRQLDSDAINTLPDARFPIAFNLIHRHRQGKPAEPHMRAGVIMNDHGGFAIFDMPLTFWDSLPELRLPARRQKPE